MGISLDKELRQLLKSGPGNDPEDWCGRVYRRAKFPLQLVLVERVPKEDAARLQDVYERLAAVVERLPKSVKNRRYVAAAIRSRAHSVACFLQGKQPPWPRMLSRNPRLDAEMERLLAQRPKLTPRYAGMLKRLRRLRRESIGQRQPHP